MLSPNDVILLLEKWTRRFVAVDIRKTDIGDDMEKCRTTTDRVHHVSEINVTTDVCMDSMTVQAQSPNSNRVNVIPGKVQWFEKIIEITENMESPILPPFTTSDCDPLITDPIRWSLLCIKKDSSENDVLFWEHGTPGLGFPEVPNLGVPLALVKTTIGNVVIEQDDIINWRSIRPGYAPGAKFQYPPVMESFDLTKYDDPVEGAQCFVLSEGNYYYYKDGEWHTAGLPSFDNTAWYRDITEATTRIDLPWPLKSRVEVLVFRDGQLMLLGKDYRVMVGPAPYLQFNHLLLPGQRIVVLRNPFMAEAFSGSGSDSVGIEQIDIYVDGQIGNDAWEGTEANPFKTLQRAFDYIPLHSMKIYIIHAKNLKKADILTVPETGDKTYGYARGKRAVTIKLDIADSIESDDVSAVAILYECGYIAFDASPVKFSIDLVECLSGFSDTPIQDTLTIHGGFTTMVRVVGNAFGNGNTMFMDGAAARVAECTFHYLNVSQFSVVRAAQCDIYNLIMDQSGMLQSVYSRLNDTVTVNDSLIHMIDTSIRAEGTFTKGYVRAVNCNNDGSAFTPVPLFFNGTHGSVFYLDNVKIDRVNNHCILLAHGSSLHMDGGYARHSVSDGVLVSFGSSAHFVGVDISYHEKSGVRGDYNSTIQFESCTGVDNKRWGCECYNLSRAGFQTLGIWGNLGGYYEQIPGSDTVVSKLGLDLSPGALDDKIVLGKGLKSSIQQGSAPSDYKYHINIDPAMIAGPGSSYVINTNARQNVIVRYSAINTVSPDTDMAVCWPGQGYISSVCQRIYDPTNRNKLMLTNASNRTEFVEMDETIGTDFLTSKVMLHRDPSLGFPVNKPYYFLSNPDGMGVVTIYGTQTVNKFTLNANAPAGTEIRVAFSTVGAGLWRTWNASSMSWELLPGESTLIQMQNAPLHTTVALWNPMCWDALRLIGGQALCVCFLLSTTSSGVSPEIYSYSWDYVEDGFLLDITHAFKRRYFNNRAIFTYDGSLGAQVDPPIVFSVMPTADRDS